MSREPSWTELGPTWDPKRDQKGTTRNLHGGDHAEPHPRTRRTSPKDHAEAAKKVLELMMTVAAKGSERIKSSQDGAAARLQWNAFSAYYQKLKLVKGHDQGKLATLEASCTEELKKKQAIDTTDKLESGIKAAEEIVKALGANGAAVPLGKWEALQKAFETAAVSTDLGSKNPKVAERLLKLLGPLEDSLKAYQQASTPAKFEELMNTYKRAARSLEGFKVKGSSPSGLPPSGAMMILSHVVTLKQPLPK